MHRNREVGEREGFFLLFFWTFMGSFKQIRGQKEVEWKETKQLIPQPPTKLRKSSPQSGIHCLHITKLKWTPLAKEDIVNRRRPKEKEKPSQPLKRGTETHSSTLHCLPHKGTRTNRAKPCKKTEREDNNECPPQSQLAKMLILIARIASLNQRSNETKDRSLSPPTSAVLCTLSFPPTLL